MTSDGQPLHQTGKLPPQLPRLFILKLVYLWFRIQPDALNIQPLREWTPAKELPYFIAFWSNFNQISPYRQYEATSMLDKKFFWILFPRRPPHDVDDLVLGRPGNFRKLTSSDIFVPVPNVILDVLVLGRSRPGPRPGRTRSFREDELLSNYWTSLMGWVKFKVDGLGSKWEVHGG